MISCVCSIQFCNTLDSKAEKFSNGTFRQKGLFLEVYLFIYFNSYSNWIHRYTIPHRGDKNILRRVRICESGAEAMCKNILQKLLDRYLNYWQLCWTISLKYTLIQFFLSMNKRAIFLPISVKTNWSRLCQFLHLTFTWEENKRINLPFHWRPIRIQLSSLDFLE